MDALLKRWWRNRKNGETKEVTLTVRQAAQHGWEPYDLPVVAQVVKPLPIKEIKEQVATKTDSGIDNRPANELPPEPKELENAALAPKPTTPKPATKKPGRKPKNPKPE